MEEQKEVGWGTVAIIILISLCIVVSAAFYKKDMRLAESNEQYQRFQQVYRAQENSTNRLYTMIVERDHLLEEQQRFDYNDLSLRFKNMEFINPYVPMADCLKIGPLDGPNFSLECQKK